MNYPSKFEFNFFKELYFKELERKDNINQIVLLHIGMFSVISSGVVYYFNKLPELISKVVYRNGQCS